MTIQRLLNRVLPRREPSKDEHQSTTEYSILQQVDLAFIVDTTASMGSFIHSARQQMTEMLRAVTGGSAMPIDLRVGIVEYRDHPPQDYTYVTKVHRFSNALWYIQKGIDKLRPDGGGDVPEAVYDGVAAAGQELLWRTHSHRLAVLIGDAPPHQACSCGMTADDATALMEEQRVVLYAIGLTNHVARPFSDLAQRTGGSYFMATQGSQAIEALQQTLKQEFGNLAFDEQVLVLCNEPDWTVDQICAELECPINMISNSLGRLGRRGLLVAGR